jgi:hypothetical protein
MVQQVFLLVPVILVMENSHREEQVFLLSYIAYIQFIRIYLCIHTQRDERLVNIIRIFIVFSRRFDHHQLYTTARSETRPIAC